MTIQDIINLYRTNSDCCEEWRFWETQKGKITLAEAIKLAATAMCNGKKFPHQWRLSNITLAEFAEKLLAKEREIGEANTFSEIMEIVIACRISGIGELAVYDTAARIGFFRKIEPDAVYLHRGTRDGVKNLLKEKFNRKAKFITKDDLPEEFRECSYIEIEAILCVHKDNFAKLKLKQ